MTTDRLITDNINLVHGICHKMPWKDQYEDMFSVGTVGLVRAAKRFRPEKGYAFSTFATAHIRGEILRRFNEVDNHGIRYSRSINKRATVQSLSHPISDDGKLTLETLFGYSEDFTSAEVSEFIDTLNPRERNICLRLLEGAYQRELAEELGVSQPQVSRTIASIRGKYLEAVG